MGWTAPQLKIILESENPEIVEYQVQTAINKASDLNGWDIFSTSREQNLNLMGEDVRTVSARFQSKEDAKTWLLSTNSNNIEMREWFDERFSWPCWIATATWRFEV